MNRASSILAALAVLGLTGCVAQHRGAVEGWYAARDAAPPRGARVAVCHAFGCHLRTTVAFQDADVARMRSLIGASKSPAHERAGLRRMIAWAERRVAPMVGSANDVPGLDVENAGRPGQMDCIDEATNTTSYLLVAQEAGLLRHHRVASPVARGFFLDGRYPHATAVIVDAGGTPFAIDSWPQANGALPDVMPLTTWFSRVPAS